MNSSCESGYYYELKSGTIKQTESMLSRNVFQIIYMQVTNYFGNMQYEMLKEHLDERTVRDF